MQCNQKLLEKEDPVIILTLKNFTLRKLPAKGVIRIDKPQLLMVILAILRICTRSRCITSKIPIVGLIP